MQVKKEPSQAATCKSSIDKHPSLVYHVIKPKGNTAMIELKITATTADELTTEVQELAKQITGSQIIAKDEEKPVTANKVAKKDPKEEAPKAEAPKVEAPKVEAPKAEAPKEVEAPKAETPKAEEPKTEEPKAEEPKKEITRDEVRAAAKDFLAKDPAKNKPIFADFLKNTIKVKSLTDMNPKDFGKVMEFLNGQA